MRNKHITIGYFCGLLLDITVLIALSYYAAIAYSRDEPAKPSGLATPKQHSIIETWIKPKIKEFKKWKDDVIMSNPILYFLFNSDKAA